MADVEEAITRDLGKLNFTENETKVYLALLSMGPSLAGAIAKQTQLDRSSTYNALKNLVEKGIVGMVHETKRTIFVAHDPVKIIDYYKEKEEIATKTIPLLRQRMSIKEKQSSVLLYRGYKGVKTVLDGVIHRANATTTHYVMGSEGQFSRNMPYYAPIFNKRKDEKNIRTRMLIRAGRSHHRPSKLTEYRCVPVKIESPATINVIEDEVAIILWNETPEAVVIADKRLAGTLKGYFDFMWLNAKKV